MVWPMSWDDALIGRNVRSDSREGQWRCVAQKLLLQLRVLRFGFLQDGDVGVSVFPEGEEILISGFRFGGVAGYSVGTGQAEVGQRAQREVHYDAAMVEKLLELSRCCLTLACQQVGLAAQIDRAQKSLAPRLGKLVRACSLQ